MVDVIGRVEVDARCGRDGWKMEDNDEGGQTGYPAEFPQVKSNKFDIFLNVRRN